MDHSRRNNKQPGAQIPTRPRADAADESPAGDSPNARSQQQQQQACDSGAPGVVTADLLRLALGEPEVAGSSGGPQEPAPHLASLCLAESALEQQQQPQLVAEGAASRLEGASQERLNGRLSLVSGRPGGERAATAGSASSKADGSSFTLSSLSAHSAPIGRDDARALPPADCEDARARAHQPYWAQRSHKHNPDKISTAELGDRRHSNFSSRSSPSQFPPPPPPPLPPLSSARGPRPRCAPSRKWGPFKVSGELYAELKSYKRSLMLLTLAFLYTMLALGAMLFREPAAPPAALRNQQLVGGAASDDEWTQEQIAGWHKSRPLELARDFPLLKGARLAGGLIRVRDCKSYAPARTESYSELVLAPAVEHPASESATNSSSGSGSSQLVAPTQAASKGLAAVSAVGRSNSTSLPRSTTTTTSTTRRPSERPKRKFAALTGCVFRRDETSDSLGDLCCCSGVPKFITLNATTTTARPTTTTTTTTSTTSSLRPRSKLAGSSARKSSAASTTSELVGWEKAGRRATSSSTTTTTTTTTTTARPTWRKYLRPQLVCFLSNAAGLFNSQKLVAPLANEFNLRNAHIRNKGKCIPCSCCHEREPELVNRMLADVPPANSKQGQRIALLEEQESSGNALTVPVELTTSVSSGGGGGGVWVSLRERLVNSMRSLEDFLFHLYDMLDLATFTLRHGAYPIDNLQLDSLQARDVLALNAVPFKAHQFELGAGAGAGAEHQQAAAAAKFLAEQQAAAESAELLARRSRQPLKSLLIDASTYDDFTTSTTTSTTTTTTTTTTSTTTTTTTSTTSTARPTTKRAKRRRKRPKIKRTNSTTTTTTTGRPGVTTLATAAATVAPEMRNKTTSTTTKGPTVIINVYAGAQTPSEQSKSATTSTRKPFNGTTTAGSAPSSSTTTRTPSTTNAFTTASPTLQPSIMLMAESAGQNQAGGPTNIKLHIELGGGLANSTASMAPRAPAATSTTTPAPTSSTWAPGGKQAPLEIAISASSNINLPAAAAVAGPAAQSAGSSVAAARHQERQIVLIWPTGGAEGKPAPGGISAVSAAAPTVQPPLGAILLPAPNSTASVSAPVGALAPPKLAATTTTTAR